MSKPIRLLLILVFVQATLAMLGSLYLSNFGDPVENFRLGVFWLAGYGFDPCQLCWWARILMYPIVPLSLMGLLKKDEGVVDYILPLAIPGFLLELYHYVLQKTNIANPFGCTGDNPCSAMSVNYGGFITIPFLCLVAFSMILLLCWQIKRRQKSAK